MKREDLVASIQKHIRETSNMDSDEPLPEDIRFHEDLGFDSLDYPNLSHAIKTEYHLSLDFEIFENFDTRPESIGALADYILAKA